MAPLEAEFAIRIQQAIRHCYGLGYPPTRLDQMVAACGARADAKQLVKSCDVPEGLKRLQKLGRIDLSFEAIMLEEKFNSLFNAAELEAARWRLRQIEKGRAERSSAQDESIRARS